MYMRQTIISSLNAKKFFLFFEFIVSKKKKIPLHEYKVENTIKISKSKDGNHSWRQLRGSLFISYYTEV